MQRRHSSMDLSSSWQAPNLPSPRERRACSSDSAAVATSYRLEWEAEKQIVKKSFATAFANLNYRFHQIVSSLQGELYEPPARPPEIGVRRPREIEDEEFVNIAESPSWLDLSQEASFGTQCRAFSWSRIGQAVKGASNKADQQTAQSDLTALLRMDYPRRETHYDSDEESRATLKNFGRRCGMLRAKSKQALEKGSFNDADAERGGALVSQEVQVSTSSHQVPKHRHKESKTASSSNRKTESYGEEAEWAMEGLSVFDDSDDDGIYGVEYAVDRIARKMRREARDAAMEVDGPAKD